MTDIIIDNDTGIVVEDVVETANHDSKSLPTVDSVDSEQRKAKKEEILEEVAAKKTELELKLGYRAVEVPPYGLLHLHKPSINDDYVADIVYAKEVAKLMEDADLPTIEEMEIKLAKRGTWTKEDKNSLEELREDLVTTATELEIARSEYKSKNTVKFKKKIDKLTKDYEETKKLFLKKEAIKSRFMSLTIEGRSDEQRLIVKMSRCVKYPDGKYVWKTPDDLKKEKDSEPVGRLVFEFITFAQGVDPRVLETVPDILKEVGDIV